MSDKRDLVFLVADGTMEKMLQGFFGRQAPHLSIGCRPIDLDLAPNRDIIVTATAGDTDGGAFKRAPDWLRGLAQSYYHVVVMIDAEWEGSPGAEAIRKQLSTDIRDAGWPDGAGLGLVLEPEVDIWLWVDSPHVATAMRWESKEALRSALKGKGWLDADEAKPKRPKEAAEWALKQKRQPRSSALYQKIASRVSLQGCTDAALLQLVDALKRWFPQEAS